MGKQAKVAVVETPTDYSEVDKAINQAVGLLGGFNRFISDGQKVLIKPNLVSPVDESTGIITHRKVISAIIDIGQKKSCQISVGDSSGFNMRGATETVLEKTGVKQLCREKDVSILNFDNQQPFKANIPNGIVLHDVYLAKPVIQTDIVINAPKLKTHVLTKMTGAIKNMFGAVPGGQKSILHRNGSNPERFAALLTDIYSVVTPKLTIMDAVTGIGGFWREQDKISPGLIIASEDGVALDAVASIILGIEPLKVPTLRIAEERGLGIASPDRIDLIGPSVDKVKPRQGLLKRLSLPSLASYSFGFLVSNEQPVVDSTRCNVCGRCIKVCPMDAIKIVDEKLEFDLEKCILCFCCLELCPERAIELTRGFLGDLILKR